MSSGPTRVAVAGVAGRMGRALLEAIQTHPGLVLGAALEQPGNSAIGLDAGTLAAAGAGIRVEDSLDRVTGDFDVLVEFTRPEPTVDHARWCAANGKRLVIGTTGLDAAAEQAVGEAARRTAIVMAPNMSVGVNICFKLLEVAARAFGDDVDVEVLEAHHRHKVDAPSGTALGMGRVLAAALGRDIAADGVFVRNGHTGARERRSIGFATLRGGDIVGEHTVYFAGEGERVEITHRASSRGNFAHGALRAATWLMGQEPGLYDMQDVLGLH